MSGAWKALAVAVLAAALASGCGEESGEGGDGPIEVGVIANLTGPDTLNGREAVRGMELAAEQINAAGGVDGRELELIVEDAEYKPVSGVNAARKLIDVDGVDILLSNAGSSVVVPVSQFASGKDALVVNSGASSTELRGLGENVVSMIPLDDRFTGGFAQWVRDQGADRVATLMPSNPFGTGLNTAFTEQFEELGGEVVASVNFKEGQQDYRPDLQRIAEADPQVIVTGAYGSDAVLLWKQAAQIGIDAPWLVAYPTGLPIRDAEGRLFGVDLGYDLPSGKSFREAYEKKFDAPSQTASAVYAYDGMQMLAKALEQAGSTDPAAVRDAFDEVGATFEGATGKIELDDDGQRSSVPYVYLQQLDDGTFEPLEGKVPVS